MQKLTEEDQERQRQQQQSEIESLLKGRLIKTIYVPKNDLLECRCVHGCEVKFTVIPHVATPKAFGECYHFRYVMLLDDDSPTQAAMELA